MKGWKLAITLAAGLALAAGACARAGQPTAPDADARMDEMQTPQDGPGGGTGTGTPTDTTGRWGGYIGGGG
jgi:hypothetical protein